MDPEQVTMYMEIGSRAYSDLSAEDSGVATALIKNRCLRAGYERPVRPKAILPAEDTTQTMLNVGKRYTAVMPLKGRSQAVVTVNCDSVTKKGNMNATITYGYGTGKYKAGKKVVVLRKDILCIAKGGLDD